MIAPSDSQTVYAATNDGRVLVSTNGGVDWTLSLTDIPGWPRVTRELAVDPLDDSVAYLAVAQFDEDQVRMTTDRGQTWTAIDGNLPDVPVNTVAVFNDSIKSAVFAGTDTGVYMSCDADGQWTEVGTNLPHAPAIDLIVDENFDRLIVATLGRGTWSIGLSVADVCEDAIPAISNWGMLTVAALLLIGGSVLFARRRSASRQITTSEES